MRLTLVLFLALTVGLSVPSQSLAGLFQTNIEKARDLAKIEKKYEAKELLDEAILDDPLDADVHYEAGLVYGQLGMTSDFDLAMKNACKLKQSYCPKVAESYYSMGFNHLNRGSQRSAIRSFEQAFTYQPAKRSEAINRLLASGKSLLSSKNINGAEMYFSALTHFSPSHKDQVAKLYFDMGQNSSSEEAITLFRKAIYYSKDYKEQAGHKLAEMAKDNKYSEKEKSAFRREAGKYLSKSEMLAYFPPDFLELKVNEDHSFPILSKGEETNIWVRSPYGKNTTFSITSNNFYKIKVRGGKTFNTLMGDKIPDNKYRDFKLIALADNLKLTVRFKAK